MSQAPTPPAAPPPAPPRSGMPVVVIVLLVMFLLVFVLGVLAAIAIPSFIKYTRRAKAAEAETNIAAIVRGIQSRQVEQGTLPPSVPATPAPAAPPVCATQTWPAAAPPGWAELGFTPFGPLRYSYSIDTAPDGRSLAVRATGDLDCDGIPGRFERTVALATDGTVVIGPLIRTDELE